MNAIQLTRYLHSAGVNDESIKRRLRIHAACNVLERMCAETGPIADPPAMLRLAKTIERYASEHDDAESIDRCIESLNGSRS